MSKEPESGYDGRQFSRAFKIEAVRLVTERGVAFARAARDHDVAESVLRHWMREVTVARKIRSSRSFRFPEPPLLGILAALGRAHAPDAGRFAA